MLQDYDHSDKPIVSEVENWRWKWNIPSFYCRKNNFNVISL